MEPFKIWVKYSRLWLEQKTILKTIITKFWNEALFD